jgi:hypothetical protein
MKVIRDNTIKVGSLIGTPIIFKKYKTMGLKKSPRIFITRYFVKTLCSILITQGKYGRY